MTTTWHKFADIVLRIGMAVVGLVLLKYGIIAAMGGVFLFLTIIGIPLGFGLMVVGGLIGAVGFHSLYWAYSPEKYKVFCEKHKKKEQSFPLLQGLASLTSPK
jgi:hypothetical protein